MNLGKPLIAAGLLLVLLGCLFLAADKLPLRPGHLPGDITIRGRHGTFYFPLATCVVLSVLLSFLMWLFGRR